MTTSLTMRFFACLATFCHLLVLTRSQVDNIARTKYGPIRGVAASTGADTMYTYWGVPFAKPPTGDLRFKQPQEPDTWTAPRDALNPSRDCMQILRYGVEKLGVQVNISEDCLYLNVFTPSTGTNSTLLPVMVWIYGGGFIMGSSAIYDGAALARKGVVVVTFNYRLDAFGFLSTEDDVIPGNFGLLDQIFALKWVKENIANFGGNPNQVTIFGESAGACSVSILTLSPLAKGLFKRAIMESGSSMAPWCVSFPKTNLPPKKTAALIGSKVNCNFPDDSRQLFNCLQKVNGASLLNASVEVQYELLNGVVTEVLSPRVETTFGVLPNLPKTLLTSGQYDHFEAIRGFNSNEEGAMKPNFTSGATRQEFRKFIADDLYPFDLSSTDDVINRFEDFYLSNISDPIQILQKSSEASSDFKFVLPALYETQLASDAIQDKKQFLYEFYYRQSVSTLPPWATSAHADELPFVFRSFNFPLWLSTSQPTSDDLGVSEQIITMWTNFAKTGNPLSTLPTGTTSWPGYTHSNTELLKIGKESKVVPAGRTIAVGYYADFVTDISTKGSQVVVG
ncbi:carboxylesterase 1C [Biomphalaria pfeifferi]|uniref:Carboxylic ester hydrolase n=1 Tax=Biomphalaria pfeifferi TaxID=112525 RepID=A0AAD8FNF1_BIOPF|nr:carboxylesterase 1C [Biomphalaria pfeifferi]